MIYSCTQSALAWQYQYQYMLWNEAPEEYSTVPTYLDST